MAMFQRGLLIYLMIAIAFVFAAPSAVIGNNKIGHSMMDFFTGVQYDAVSNQVTNVNGVNINQDYQDITQENNTNGLFSSGSGTTNSLFSIIIDPLVNLLSFITLIFSVLLSPIILMTSPQMQGAPPAIMLLLALPLVVLFFSGIALVIGGRYEG